MSKETTHIVFVLDRSGSMAAIAADAAGGFNSFVEAQKALPGKARITLIQFDDIYEIVCDKVKLKDAPVLEVGKNYIPRGSTALNDALGKAITTHETETKVIVGVMTDGQENASKEYKTAAIKDLVERKTKDGWEFHYLSSDINTFADASLRGFAMANTMQVTPDSAGNKAAYVNMSTRTADYRSTR